MRKKYSNNFQYRTNALLKGHAAGVNCHPQPTCVGGHNCDGALN